MPPTIQISDELKAALKARKTYSKESYEDVIWDLIEDQLTLKDEVINNIKEGRKEYREGKYYTAEEIFAEE